MPLVREVSLPFSLLLFVLLQFSCSTPAQIIREGSSTVKPGWITHPPQQEDSLYFVGISTGAETLEQGQEAATKNAVAKIAGFLSTRVQSTFEEQTTEIEQNLKQQITAKSTASVLGAHLVDSYHEKLVRIDKKFRLEKYDVYVLINFPKGQIEKELARQQDEKTQKVKTAYAFYLKGKDKEKERSYADAKGFYKQALDTQNDLEDVVVLDQGGIKNSNELSLLVKAGLQNTVSQMRRLALSVNVDGLEKADQAFRSNFAASLERHGFNMAQEDPTIEILGEVSVSKSGFVMNNFVYYAEGSLSAVRKSDRKVIATIPFKTKGFHQSKEQAALNAISEAGTEAGENVAKILLEKEKEE